MAECSHVEFASIGVRVEPNRHLSERSATAAFDRNDLGPRNDNRIEDEILTVEEAAAFLRVGRSQLYDAIGRGDVPHRRIGRSIRLARSELVRWLGRAECR